MCLWFVIYFFLSTALFWLGKPRPVSRGTFLRLTTCNRDGLHLKDLPLNTLRLFSAHLKSAITAWKWTPFNGYTQHQRPTLDPLSQNGLLPLLPVWLSSQFVTILTLSSSSVFFFLSERGVLLCWQWNMTKVKSSRLWLVAQEQMKHLDANGTIKEKYNWRP